MKLPAQHRNANHLNRWRISFAIVCSILLSLAPRPVFAQHGGGGSGGGSHGGGSSGGGHSGGGSHASGGSHSGTAGGRTSTSNGGSSGGVHGVSASHSGSRTVAASNAPYGGSHIWIGQGGGSSIASMPVERFAAGNNIWQDPPSARPSSLANSNTAAIANAASQKGSVVASTRPFVPPAAPRGPLFGNAQTLRPPVVFIPQPRHRFFDNDFFFGGGCFGGFFPGFCGSSLWWGPGSAWGPGCDPVLGCTGYGYPNYGLDAPDDAQMQLEMQSREEYGPFRWQDSPAGGSSDSAEASKPPATIYLKDGASYGVTDYWLADGNLHYITNYGGENSIPVERLDLQRTVDENTTLGVSFILSNQPAPRQ